MSYLWVERRADGTTLVERRGLSKAEVAKAPRQVKYGPSGGYWQLSATNGIIGKDALAKQRAIEAQHGADGLVDYVEVRPGVYKAGFLSKRDKNNWLRRMKRFDADACYDAPAPGDFRGNMPPEFE